MSKIKVGIADDHKFLRESISMLFKLDDRFSLNIVAENGKELIDQLTEKIVNVVILDIRMPVLNGIKTLEIIKEKHPEIKVVIFSSQSDHLTVQTARRIGTNSFVDKHSHELLIDTVIQVYHNYYSYNKVFKSEL